MLAQVCNEDKLYILFWDNLPTASTAGLFWLIFLRDAIYTDCIDMDRFFQLIIEHKEDAFIFFIK